MARLLIVDDEPDMRSLMQTVLERETHKVDCAPGAKEAVDLLSLRTYDAILMDIDMPGMNGIELTRLLRDNPRFLGYRDTPVIMVTGKTDPNTMGESFDAGAVFFLQKPFGPRELNDTVRVVLQTQR